MNEGIDQSMLPRLKSPPTHMFEEFVLSNLLVMKYKEANWDQIKKDLENTLTTMNNVYEKSDTNILWNTFKNDIIFKMKSPCNMNITICTNESPVPLIGFTWVDKKT
jgi:hypothetical protein